MFPSYVYSVYNDNNSSTYVLQVIEALIVSLHDAGSKATRLRIKITILESDTDGFQWYFIRSKLVVDCCHVFHCISMSQHTKSCPFRCSNDRCNIVFHLSFAPVQCTLPISAVQSDFLAMQSTSTKWQCGAFIHSALM